MPDHQEETSMKSKLLSIAIAAALAVGVPITQAQQGKLSGDTVKIGVLTDMSGLYADYGGPGAVAAARLAVQDFGGRIFGRNIEVVSADHQNKPDVAKNITQQWFDRDGVDMTVENLNSAVALTVQALGREKNKITIVTGAATSRLTNEDCAPATGIHYLMDTIALSNVVGKAIVKDGGDSWFFLTADYAFGHSLEKDTGEVVRAAGGRVAGAVRHPLATGDFSSFLLQAQSSRAKVVGLANAGGWYWDLNAETRAWADKYSKVMNGRKPNSNHASVYSATMHYLKAIQAAGTDDTAAVMAKMREMPINDMFAKGGVLRPDGRMVHDMYLFQVKKPSESKGAWDYFNLKGTIKGSDAFLPLAQSRCAAVKK
jgi:branched-chain amino acid transport system substrate-binding protein